MDNQYPILEFDASYNVAISPGMFSRSIRDLPDRAVLCFFSDVINNIKKNYPKISLVGSLTSEMGLNPVYVLEHANTQIALIHPGVGAPLVVSFLEELIAHGVKKIMACGSAGVLLEESISENHIILPTVAIRDEGTSYHYLPPSREISTNWMIVEKTVCILTQMGIPYVIGKTWTTDAIFRETFPKIFQRKSEGCISVEMEAAAMLAVAEYRKIMLGIILYGSDDFKNNTWNRRYLENGSYSTREKLFWTTVEIVKTL